MRGTGYARHGGDGTRAIVTEPWTSFECPPDALEDAEWVHVDHVGYEAVRGHHRLSVDGGNPIPGRDLSRVELYATRPTVATRPA